MMNVVWLMGDLLMVNVSTIHEWKCEIVFKTYTDVKVEGPEGSLKFGNI